MSPRTPHALLCFLVSLTFGHAADFNWSDHGTIDVDVPADWKMSGTATEESGYTFFANPRSGANSLLQMSVLPVPDGVTLTDDDLREKLRESLRSYIEQSVEKSFRARPLTCRQGTGWYAELTDASLVGKPPAPAMYKVMRSALLLLTPRTMLIATMLFDDPTSPEAREMLAIAASVKFKPNPE